MADEPSPRIYRATVEADPTAAARIALALEEADSPQALSVSVFELDGGSLFEVSALYDAEPETRTLHALIGEASSGAEVSPLRVERLPETDWVTLSQGQRGPVRAGRFLIHGSHDRDNIVRTRTAIEIDADQAFGTAHHATTRACLLVLDGLAKWGRPELVLDLGTGTGVLAIAAAIAFDRPVIATDNDPVAIRIADENAAKAGVAQNVQTLVAEGLDNPLLRRLQPDLIVANILAGPLYELAPAMARTIAPGGYVLLSGITASQARATAARYRYLGFSLQKQVLLDGWAALLLGSCKPGVLAH